MKTFVICNMQGLATNWTVANFYAGMNGYRISCLRFQKVCQNKIRDPTTNNIRYTEVQFDRTFDSLP